VNSNEPVGSIFKVPAEEVLKAPENNPMVFLHSMKWNQALSYAKKILLEDYPDDIQVYLIAIENTRLEIQLSDEVSKSGEKVIKMIREEINQLHKIE
jgi:hydrogenase maturation protease